MLGFPTIPTISTQFGGWSYKNSYRGNTKSASLSSTASEDCLPFECFSLPSLPDDGLAMRLALAFRKI